MGKPRLPTSGIRKPRAKDKRVGRKRTPRDEMEVARTAFLFPSDDVHKVGDRFEWCEPETIQPQDGAALKVVRYSRKWSNKVALAYPSEPETVFDDPVPERLAVPVDFDPFESPVIQGDFGGPHETREQYDFRTGTNRHTVPVDPRIQLAVGLLGMSDPNDRDHAKLCEQLCEMLPNAEDRLRSQAVVDRARAEIDAVPEYQLDDTEPQP